MKLLPADLLPPPNEMGGPVRFSTWRQEQVDGIMRLSDTTKRFPCFNMPTGSGKSVTSSMSARVLGARTLILTANKALQNQYVKDELTDADIRGQENYECVAVRPGGPLFDYAEERSRRVTVDRGPCHVGVQCWMKFNGCSHYDAVRFAREQEIVVTNYDYWLAIGKSIRAGRGDEVLGKFDRLVLDEAHEAVNKTCSALKIELDTAELSGMLNVNPLPLDAEIVQWKAWGEVVAVTWSDVMDRMMAALRREYVSSEAVDEIRTMQKLGMAIEQITELEGDWVVGKAWKGNKVTFDPVWPTAYTEELLFRKTPSVLLMSATITPKTLDILGVEKDDREYVEYPSTFPVERRPVHIIRNLPRVDWKMSGLDEELWLAAIDNFLGPRLELGRKGIVHCVSYDRMRKIRKRSKFRGEFIWNEDSSETHEAIRRYKGSSQPVVLLSPSVSTGEDFPDDECRFVYIPKLPFVDTRDPVMKRREAGDKGYGGYLMMTTLVQSAGRGMRSGGDWCETVIGDGHAEWALPAFKKHAPKYFVDAWRWGYALPRPLEV